MGTDHSSTRARRPLDWPLWESRFERFVAQSRSLTDVAHDLLHVRRVVANARELTALEGARPEIVLPAAWLHDCVAVPKHSPQRGVASVLAARAAGTFLRDSSYLDESVPEIEHAIEAHSFSAGIAPRTREAMVVQDADRLDALGAIGIARCLMVSGAMGKTLYDPCDPFSHVRIPDDTTNVLDHFYVKLLKLVDTMTTTAGRVEARRRTGFMQQYLQQLGHDIQPGFEKRA